MRNHPFDIRIVRLPDVPSPMVDVHRSPAPHSERLFRGMSGGEASAFVKGFLAGKAEYGKAK